MGVSLSGAVVKGISLSGAVVKGVSLSGAVNKGIMTKPENSEMKFICF